MAEEFHDGSQAVYGSDLQWIGCYFYDRTNPVVAGPGSAWSFADTGAGLSNLKIKASVVESWRGGGLHAASAQTLKVLQSTFGNAPGSSVNVTSGDTITVNLASPGVVTSTKFTALAPPQAFLKQGNSGLATAYTTAVNLLGAVCNGGFACHMTGSTGSTFQQIDQNPSVGVYNYTWTSGNNRSLYLGSTATARWAVKTGFDAAVAAGAAAERTLIVFGCEGWKNGANSESTFPRPDHFSDHVNAVIDALLAGATNNGGVKYWTHVSVWNEMKSRVANGLAAGWESDATLNPDTTTAVTTSNWLSVFAIAYTQFYNLLFDAIKAHANPIVNTVEIGGPHYAFGGSLTANQHKYPLGSADNTIAPWSWDYDCFVYWLKWSHGYDFISIDYSLVDNNDSANANTAYILANRGNMGNLIAKVKNLRNTYAGMTSAANSRADGLNAAQVLALKRTAPIDHIEYYWDVNLSRCDTNYTEDVQAMQEALVVREMYVNGVRKAYKWMPEGQNSGTVLQNLNSWFRAEYSANITANSSSGLVTNTGSGTKYLAYDAVKLFKDNFPPGTQLYDTTSTNSNIVCMGSAAKVLAINTAATSQNVTFYGVTQTIPPRGYVVLTSGGSGTGTTPSDVIIDNAVTGVTLRGVLARSQFYSAAAVAEVAIDKNYWRVDSDRAGTNAKSGTVDFVAPAREYDIRTLPGLTTNQITDLMRELVFDGSRKLRPSDPSLWTPGALQVNPGVPVSSWTPTIANGWPANAVFLRTRYVAPIAADGGVLPAGWSRATGTGTGTSKSDPWTFRQAILNWVAGDDVIVCDGVYPCPRVTDGTAYGSPAPGSDSPWSISTRDGTALNPIRFRSENRLGAKLIWLSTTKADDIFQITRNYVILDGFDIDGNVAASPTFPGKAGVHALISAAHHVVVQNCYAHHLGQAGIALEPPGGDYLRIDSNVCYLTGVNSTGEPSGISQNMRNVATTPDGYNGFHCYIVNNIVGGSDALDTDGNGIIVDSGKTAAGTLTVPNTLVANNIVYWNGNRGIHNFKCDGAHLVAHNTCITNALDTTMSSPAAGTSGEFSQQQAAGSYANNVAIPWQGSGATGSIAYNTVGTPVTVTDANNYYVVGRKSNSASYTASELMTFSSVVFPNVPIPTNGGTGQHLLAPAPVIENFRPSLAPNGGDLHLANSTQAAATGGPIPTEDADVLLWDIDGRGYGADPAIGAYASPAVTSPLFSGAVATTALLPESQSVTALVSGLAASTLYHYRVSAVRTDGSGGTQVSSDMTFTTQSSTLVTTPSAYGPSTAVSTTSTVAGGTFVVKSDGKIYDSTGTTLQDFTSKAFNTLVTIKSDTAGTRRALLPGLVNNSQYQAGLILTELVFNDPSANFEVKAPGTTVGLDFQGCSGRLGHFRVVNFVHNGVRLTESAAAIPCGATTSTWNTASPDLRLDNFTSHAAAADGSAVLAVKARNVALGACDPGTQSAPAGLSGPAFLFDGSAANDVQDVRVGVALDGTTSIVGSTAGTYTFHLIDQRRSGWEGQLDKPVLFTNTTGSRPEKPVWLGVSGGILPGAETSVNTTNLLVTTDNPCLRNGTSQNLVTYTFKTGGTASQVFEVDATVWNPATALTSWSDTTARFIDGRDPLGARVSGSAAVIANKATLDSTFVVSGGAAGSAARAGDGWFEIRGVKFDPGQPSAQIWTGTNVFTLDTKSGNQLKVAAATSQAGGVMPTIPLWTGTAGGGVDLKVTNADGSAPAVFTNWPVPTGAIPVFGIRTNHADDLLGANAVETGVPYYRQLGYQGYDAANSKFTGVVLIPGPSGGAMNPEAGEILGVTAATPGVVTTFFPHGMATNDQVLIAGNTQAAANGTFKITRLSSITFSLQTTAGVNVAIPTPGTGGTYTPKGQGGVGYTYGLVGSRSSGFQMVAGETLDSTMNSNYGAPAHNASFFIGADATGIRLIGCDLFDVGTTAASTSAKIQIVDCTQTVSPLYGKGIDYDTVDNGVRGTYDPNTMPDPPRMIGGLNIIAPGEALWTIERYKVTNAVGDIAPGKFAVGSVMRHCKWHHGSDARNPQKNASTSRSGVTPGLLPQTDPGPHGDLYQNYDRNSITVIGCDLHTNAHSIWFSQIQFNYAVFASQTFDSFGGHYRFRPGSNAGGVNVGDFILITGTGDGVLDGKEWLVTQIQTDSAKNDVVLGTTTYVANRTGTATHVIHLTLDMRRNDIRTSKHWDASDVTDSTHIHTKGNVSINQTNPLIANVVTMVAKFLDNRLEQTDGANGSWNLATPLAGSAYDLGTPNRNVWRTYGVNNGAVPGGSASPRLS